MGWIVATAVALLVLYLARRAVFRGLFGLMQRHPEVRARMDEVERSYAAEEAVVEEADWFGTTGLGEELERELPKYLRREFGELLLDEDSLKARDLRYLGAFEESEGTVHYWSVPSSHGQPTFAYIELGAAGPCTGWGNRSPPAGDPSGPEGRD